MPSTLPPNADQSFLRKEAKELLFRFKHDDADAIERFATLGSEQAPKLADAQFLIARTYGFESWSVLRKHVESIRPLNDSMKQRIRSAIEQNDADSFRRILQEYPALKESVNEPIPELGAPLICHVGSIEMLDVLLEAGADINARSDWWAGGFGVLDCAPVEVAAHAIERGASVTPHAAARLGMVDRLRALIDANSGVVHAKGGDGQTPLHFASTIEIAALLLDSGADIDALDTDHVSTPAQYMVTSRREIARYLVGRGCKTDILMAAALGDQALVHQLLRGDADCIRMRVSDEFFPMVGGRNGGTIYQWELGWYVSAAEVAHALGDSEMFRVLIDRSPEDERLLTACRLHDEALVKAIRQRSPGIEGRLSQAVRRHVAHAARNNDTKAVELMVASGFPVAGVYGQHHATPLHWASWHGNKELVQMLLSTEDVSLENSDNDFGSSPLNWAIHGSENGWFKEKGNYGTTVEYLLSAGALPPERPSGTSEVRAALRRFTSD